MSRKKKPIAGDRVAWGGPEVRCPNGHNRVNLSSGRDSRGKFLHVWCSEPGCNMKCVIRRGDLG